MWNTGIKGQFNISAIHRNVWQLWVAGAQRKHVNPPFSAEEVHGGMWGEEGTLTLMTNEEKEGVREGKSTHVRCDPATPTTRPPHWSFETKNVCTRARTQVDAYAHTRTSTQTWTDTHS